MIGTLVNTGTIVVGSIVGSMAQKNIEERYQERMLQGVGLVALSLGMTWIVKNLTKSSYPLLFVASMVLGAFIGEWLDLDQKVNKLGEKYRKTGEKSLIEGLVTAVLLFCIGTLSILGPIESSLNNDNTLLFTNAILDGFTSMILASTFGIGIILSGAILFIWQGSIYLSAGLLGPYATPEIMGEISIIGGILILSTGMNILKITKIKTLNLLPALLIPVLYFIPIVSENIDKITQMLIIK
ncbi:DUF554 domain-containing protein [Ilyobacter polytropus]|uniref:Transport protein n=1 Tax=Ilyobacter polytropus (strain ATCC 51220 / DSM 2926 / LMG 16218 / CuHBu1) TaxID=572544 RepID=E3HDK6_ILYPC|nr:DUF554 domain-containing protein [Ilyobacter polytropus]ADO84192.1 protein of unknown function DUF554 [Ilyobacter polytropus DSM 2926]